MEFSTRQRPFNLADFTNYDVRYVVQYHGNRFISANSIEDLKPLCKSEIGVELSEPLVESSDVLYKTNELKILIHVSDRMYHVLLDAIPLILKIHKLHPDAKFVLYLRGDTNSEKTNIFHQCLIEVLEELGANYFIIYNGLSNKHSPVYKISNFIYLDHTKFNIHDTLSLSDTKDTVDFLKAKYLDHRKPMGKGRKVYLARPRIERDFGAEVFSGDGSYVNDVRIHEEPKLKKFFLSKGYELLLPETKFASFGDQIRYMSEVEVLAAVSSSGLANCLFMEPGSQVIEILAEVVTVRSVRPDGQLSTNQKLPAEYFPLSFLMGHNHLMIPTNRSADVAIERLKLAI